MRVLATVLAVVASAAPAVAQDRETGAVDLFPRAFVLDEPAEAPNVGLGPLRVGSLSPFQSLRVGLLPHVPSSHPRGHLDVRESVAWTNQWGLKDDQYLLDFETLHSTISLAYGVTDALELEISAVQRDRFGGRGDGFIQGFHDLAGLGQGGRDTVSRDDYAFRVGDVSAARGTFADSLVVTALHTLTPGGEAWPALAWSLAVRTDLRDSPDVRSERAVDVALSVSAAKRFWDFHAYAAVGFAWFGEARFHDVPLRETMVSVLAAVEWRFADSMSLVVQYLYSQGVTTRLGELSDASHEITLGWAGEIGPVTVLEIGLVENLVTFDNSPDFGVHVGIAYRLGRPAPRDTDDPRLPRMAHPSRILR